MYSTIATIFTRYRFHLFETYETDVEMSHAYLVPYVRWDSKGIRAIVKRLVPDK